uniref:MADS-box domain-containing protein n=1 Tax=Leersia perrieri TaxID=77586 RepID=A0A0D9WKW8_9ORYZ
MAAAAAVGGGRRRGGRREMRRIEDATSRQVTFSKRRKGLLKKASELSVLCDAEVALLVFSPRGRFFHFASAPDLEDTIDRYISHTEEAAANKKPGELTAHKMKIQAETIATEIGTVEAYTRKMQGEDLESCSLQELNDLEMQLEKSLSSIQLQQQEKILSEENALLLSDLQCKVQHVPSEADDAAPERELNHQHSRDIDVDTELKSVPKQFMPK